METVGKLMNVKETRSKSLINAWGWQSYMKREVSINLEHGLHLSCWRYGQFLVEAKVARR